MLAPCEEGFEARPGTGRIKLHADSARAFLPAGTGSEPLHPQAIKRSFVLDAALVQRTALPLTHLLVLTPPDERKRTASFRIEKLSQTALFQQLLKSSFNVEIVTRARLQQQFAWAAGLAERIDGYQLHVPDGLGHLPFVRQGIVDHVRRAEPVRMSGRTAGRHVELMEAQGV